jgi:serine/threonine-protein kinase
MPNNANADFFALQEALVGRYSVHQEIGRGGMGIVYLAHDVSLDRPVALKLLPPALAAQPGLRDRFIREARTAAKLAHPNIVAIHAVEEVDDFVFFVMAYVEGETLEERVLARGALPPSEAARVLREIAWALAYAHSHGVVHRDVKPDNVLLDSETGRAMVMDFGIAQVSEGPGMTAVGEVLGTAEFMSPEQASGEEVDVRTDVYALGVLGHYVLTGRLPFQGSTVAATLAQHLTQPAPSLTVVAPEVPAPLARIVERCLEKNREARFDDGEKLAEELSRTFGERRVVPVPLRSFIEQSQERFKGAGGWAFFGLYFFVLSVGAALAGIPLASAMGALFAIAMGAAPVGLLARMTRALRKAGYDRGDLVGALEARLQARREEMSFELGAQKTWLDRLGYGMVLGGLGAMTLGTAAAAFLDLSSMPGAAAAGIGALTLGGFIASLAGMPLAFLRMGHGRRLPGERWLKFWKSKAGQWFFHISGLRLERPAVTPGYRPTEMLIGTAADRLFEGLPKETRRELGELPAVIRRLEDDAQRMRRQMDELDGLVEEIDATPERGDGGERVELRADLEKARSQAHARMTEAVSALETIRLGLLRLHAGEGTVAGLTAELGNAREIAQHIDRLVAGRHDVDALAPSHEN